jgi:hypothetical protein
MYRVADRRGSARAKRRAVLIGRCSDPQNIWTAEELPASNGRDFDAYGVKSACGSRLCGHCLKFQQARAQRELEAARNEFWRTHTREPGKFERFITLTSPTLGGVSLYDSEVIYNKAFAALIDTAFWTKRVDAGAKHIEFTINRIGYHTHAHAMVYSRFMEIDPAQEAKSFKWRADREKKARARKWKIVKDDLPPLGNLQDEWTRCITQAALAHGGHLIDWHANYSAHLAAFALGPYCNLETREERVPEVKVGRYSRWPLTDTDGEIVVCHPTPGAKGDVHIRLVREKGRVDDNEKEIGLNSAVKELTKYITKSSSWDGVKADQLVEIAEVRRWRRCFERLGKWRKEPRPKAVGPYCDMKTREEIMPRVKVKSASVSDLLGRWRTPSGKRRSAKPLVTIGPRETWTQFCLRADAEDAHASSYALALEAIKTRERKERERKAAAGGAKAAAGGAIANLDTNCISRRVLQFVPGLSAADRGPPGAESSLWDAIKLWFTVLLPAWPREELSSWAGCVFNLFFLLPTRSRPLMEIGEEMDFAAWLVIVELRLWSARASRIQQLEKKYPFNVFVCLDGSRFIGSELRRLTMVTRYGAKRAADENWIEESREMRERNSEEIQSEAARWENFRAWGWIHDTDDSEARMLRKSAWDIWKAREVERDSLRKNVFPEVTDGALSDPSGAVFFQ